VFFRYEHLEDGDFNSLVVGQKVKYTIVKNENPQYEYRAGSVWVLNS